MFFFLAPLVGKIPGVDWEMVCRLLGGTLRSVLNQADPHFRMLVTGQDKPAIPELQDARIEFLRTDAPYPSHPSEGNLDKAAKFSLLIAAAMRQNATSIAFLDSDDRVSANIVKYYRENPHRHGYLYESGYVWDYKANCIAPSFKVLKAPFYMRCGTSLIVNVAQLKSDFNDDPNEAAKYIVSLGKHTEYEKNAKAASRPFGHLPFPAAIYVLNHGVGLHYRRGWRTGAKDKRHGRIRRHAIEVSGELRREFSLEGNFPSPPASLLTKLKRHLSLQP